MNTFLKQYGLLLAWLIALIAMLSTLYFSEVMQWPVCPLCWYQRIALYPLVILLGIAAYKNDRHIVPYAYPFCVIGFVFGLYQYLEQMIPGFAPIDLCKQGISCNVIHMKLLGFITIPFLSIMACLVIMLLLYCAHTKDAQ
jgi:disulfide bond formation protein DsbB